MPLVGLAFICCSLAHRRRGSGPSGLNGLAPRIPSEVLGEKHLRPRSYSKVVRDKTRNRRRTHCRLWFPRFRGIWHFSSGARAFRGYRMGLVIPPLC
jgi:hypothetical protein